MLLSLRIENFALIDRLEQEFGPGLNVLTGETGAGKSIILDAIDVALGGTASSRLLRTGSQRGLVEATFALSDRVCEWLQAQEIELLDDGSVVCSREMKVSQGSLRSRMRINGILANRKLMGQLRDLLVEIAAQGQTVQLMVPANQRELLDIYGGQALLERRGQVTRLYESCRKAEKALESRKQSEQERLQRLDWLKYQLQELNAADLKDPDELLALERERDRLFHIVELQQQSYQAYQVLYQNDTGAPAGADLLGQAEAILTDMVAYDSQLELLLDLVREAQTQVVEAGKQIYSYGAGLESEPERLVEVEERLRLLKHLCRKYGPELGDAIAYAQKLQAELEDLTHSSQSLEALEQDYRCAREEFEQASVKLTQDRQTAATRLEKTLIEELKPLAMEKVQFECRIVPTSESSTGRDRVVYYFSPNPGESAQPLSETASGGEMSRFLLALKACLSQAEARQRTLIFDEIDAGVSGKVAGAIAEKLHHLSRDFQVLCVTHQPLVAAMADAHFRVDKQIIDAPAQPVTVGSRNGNSKRSSDRESEALAMTDLRTVVRVTQLQNHQTRRQELAQLAGGNSTQDAIAFAESLLARAAGRKQPRSIS